MEAAGLRSHRVSPQAESRDGPTFIGVLGYTGGTVSRLVAEGIFAHPKADQPGATLWLKVQLRRMTLTTSFD